jgi:hypothetical protein
MSPGRYRVIWKRSAIELELASAVVRAMQGGQDVAAITRAMDVAERVLSVRPNDVGESRPEFERLEVFDPLTIRYAVHEDERIVYVLHVVYAPPRPRG